MNPSSCNPYSAAAGTPLARPTARQIRHAAREFYGFLHFTTNTFTDREWGFGDESPAIFNPTAFDAAQIVDTARRAGMTGLILTCKHHDGFCLWPSRFNTHNVSRSPFRDGKGNVVREIEQACRAAGLEFGVYLSPWDRHHADYGTPAYVHYFRSQLQELLTEYGEIFEVWFDGANGGDGYYGGTRERRQIDNRTYYDWSNTWNMVRQWQPNAVMFSDAGPDVRWIGNESGIAGNPCWSSITIGHTCPGNADQAYLNRGDPNGVDWLVPECDVSIRHGWFYHQTQDSSVRSAKNLVDLYFASVGRGANFLLNLPPDRRGLIHEIDCANLMEFRAHLQATFGCNLASSAKVQRTRTDHEIAIILELSSPQQANVLDLREEIAGGHRVMQWIAEVETDSGHWQPIAQGTAIGTRQLARFEAITAKRWRVRLLRWRDEPLISAIGLYREPHLAEKTLTVEHPIHPARVTPVSSNELLLEFGQEVPLHGIRYTPSFDHRADHYQITLIGGSHHPSESPLTGEFGNICFNTAPQIVPCQGTATAVRFQATRFALGSMLAPSDVDVF